jgi:hypothetical protein
MAVIIITIIIITTVLYLLDRIVRVRPAVHSNVISANAGRNQKGIGKYSCNLFMPRKSSYGVPDENQNLQFSSQHKIRACMDRSGQ